MNYLRRMYRLSHRDDGNVSGQLVDTLNGPTIANAMGIDWDCLRSQRIIGSCQIAHSEWIVRPNSGAANVAHYEIRLELIQVIEPSSGPIPLNVVQAAIRAQVVCDCYLCTWDGSFTSSLSDARCA